MAAGQERQGMQPGGGKGRVMKGALTLSRLVLSGQLRSGSKRCLPPSQPPRPSQVRYPPAQCQACGVGGRGGGLRHAPG